VCMMDHQSIPLVFSVGGVDQSNGLDLYQCV
jgi:hypothetical protein